MEVTAETPQNTVESTQAVAPAVTKPTQRARQFNAKQIAARITVETARVMNARRTFLRQQRIEAEAEAAAKAKAAEEQFTQSEAGYRKQRLTRTREQLAKLDAWFDEAEDWKAAKAICEAIARLAVIEANLAGRPGPGNRQPSKERSAPASTTAEPL